MVNKKIASFEHDKDTLLILEFMINNGFNPKEYRNILELVQSAPSSISRYLNGCKQFLLSNKVNYSELEQLGIDGANGKIDIDKYSPIKINNPVKWISLYPHILDFDSVVAYHDWTEEDINQIKVALAFPIKYHHYVFSNGINDPHKDKRIESYYQLLEVINATSKVPHKIVDAEYRDKDKHVFMITRK